MVGGLGGWVWSVLQACGLVLDLRFQAWVLEQVQGFGEEEALSLEFELRAKALGLLYLVKGGFEQGGNLELFGLEGIQDCLLGWSFQFLEID